MKIAEQIKKLRKGNMTQKELAEKLNKSERIIQKYESGEVTPSIETLYAIAQALGVNSQDFFYERDIEEDDFNLITSSYVLESILKTKTEHVIPFVKYINDNFLKTKYDVEELLSTNTEELLNHKGNYDDLIYLLIDVISNRLHSYEAKSSKNKNQV